MKVWIVSYEDEQGLVGVFSTKNFAIRAAKNRGAACIVEARMDRPGIFTDVAIPEPPPKPEPKPKPVPEPALDIPEEFPVEGSSGTEF
jgi:hypothetical protein